MRQSANGPTKAATVVSVEVPRPRRRAGVLVDVKCLTLKIPAPEAITPIIGEERAPLATSLDFSC